MTLDDEIYYNAAAQKNDRRNSKTASDAEGGLV